MNRGEKPAGGAVGGAEAPRPGRTSPTVAAGRAWWRAWWRAYAVGALVTVYLVYGLISGTIMAVRERGWAGAALLVTLFGVAVASGAVASRRAGAAGNAALLAVAVAAGLAAHGLAEYSGTTIMFVAVWMAPFRTRLPYAVLLALLGATGFVLVSVRIPLPADATWGIAFGIGWAVVLAAVFHQLALTRRQGAAMALARSREAVLAERQRLAREIHDILAHSLSAQVMHLEGARLLLERGDDPAQALTRVIRAGDLARAGLAETRRAVEALRGDSAPVGDQLEQLAGVYRAATGVPCTVSVSGDPRRLPPEARLAVVRTAQEALTNVRKHACGAEVSMSLRGRDGWFELQVRDTGPRTPPAAAPGGTGARAAEAGGYGLVGMRERAELIGGSLDAGPEDTGFLVRLRVPA